MPKIEPDLDLMAENLSAAYANEKARLAALEAAGISTGERKNIAAVRRLAEGFGSVLSKIKSDERRTAVLRLTADFIQYGAKAVLLTGSQRGGAFLNNQLRGQWAERVVLSMKLEGTTIVPFGPSGAAMPGEEDHRKTIMTFREIMLLEGKRPDCIAFDHRQWTQLSDKDRRMAETWPSRLLEPNDDTVITKGKYAIEVKNSTWHYEARRKAGGGPLSITVKEEEVEDIKAWEAKTGVAVMFFQVLFDEVYCMSFRRMLDGIVRGFVYEKGDYQLDETSGADGKYYHRFHLNNLDHLCAKVLFPDASVANVRILPDGSVIPYIDFRPAQANEESGKAIETELAYAASAKR